MLDSARTESQGALSAFDSSESFLNLSSSSKHKNYFDILFSADKFDKDLKIVIDSFEKAKEWADLSNCLQKVKRQIDQNKGLPIPRQRELAKRLGKYFLFL